MLASDISRVIPYPALSTLFTYSRVPSGFSFTLDINSVLYSNFVHELDPYKIKQKLLYPYSDCASDRSLVSAQVPARMDLLA
jgi:hypothetical protein